jgi:hypothetical protein
LPSGAEVFVQSDRLELRVRRAGATVNDVEVNGTAALHAGDSVSEGQLEYLVLPAPLVEGEMRGAMLDHWTWLLRLEEELAGGCTSLTILVGRSGAFASDEVGEAVSRFSHGQGALPVVGRLGRNALEVLIRGASPDVEAVKELASDRAGRKEETVRWGLATFPVHGATGEELWSLAVDRLLGMDAGDGRDLVWSDPCMTRLRELAGRWSLRAGLALIGPEGAGRASLAQYIRAARAPEAPFVVHRAARFDRRQWMDDVGRAAGGSLHVRRPEILPDAERGSYWSATAFRPSVGLGLTASWPPPGDRLVVPALSQRPADVQPIAEVVLHAVDVQLGRRRSSLRGETRQILQSLTTRENVRTLRNVVFRGALNATSAEVRSEHLDLPSASPASSGVRAKLRETERREIEAALQRSGWNVTDAARRMKLPRRTLVYRMTRLGLRRPSGTA